MKAKVYDLAHPRTGTYYDRRTGRYRCIIVHVDGTESYIGGYDPLLPAPLRTLAERKIWTSALNKLLGKL